MSDCPECGGVVPASADRCPYCSSDLGDPASGNSAGDDPAYRDKYWDRIKTLLALFFGAFVLYIVAYLIRVPAAARGQDSALTGYPVVAAFAVIWALMVVTFPLPLLYFVSKDKAVLSREYDDITNRHWLTVGVFSLFSYGLYLLWYFYSRYTKVDSSESATGGGIRRQLALVWVPVTKVRTALSGARDRSTTGEETSSSSNLTEQAENAVAEGDVARGNGEYEAAIAAYERALSQYDRARDRSPAGSDREEALEDSLAVIREKRQATRDERDQFDEIRQPLRAAESSLQTAIAEHTQNERTPARRDYRQAKDQYDRALTALDESGLDVFGEGSGLTVSVTTETARLPEQLSEWSNLSESDRDALASAGVGTLTELQDAGEQTITNLVDEGRLDAGLANRLRMALRWHGDGDRTFSSRRAIERQRDRARDGQQTLS